MSYKMKGFSGFGNSPVKKKFEPHNMYDKKKAETHKEHLALKKKGYGHSPLKGKIKEFLSEVKEAKDFITKPTLYKRKNLKIKGRLDLGKGSKVGWNGGPTINLKNKAGISGQYKIGKNTTLSGGVDFHTGSKPSYKAGLKINI